MTTIANTVPLPEAGPGVEIAFSFADLRKIETAIHPIRDWAPEVLARLDRLDVGFMGELVTVGAKRQGEPVEVKIDDLNISANDLADRLADAFALKITGKRQPKVAVHHA